LKGQQENILDFHRRLAIVLLAIIKAIPPTIFKNGLRLRRFDHWQEMQSIMPVVSKECFDRVKLIEFIHSLIDSSDAILPGRKMAGAFVNCWENVAWPECGQPFIT